ncbi:Lipopolysaccharide export system ATP-binding protein LptB [Burkholderiales bacterium]|nr:MAG: ABC transporter ATP-binding protein [Burkholderiales bacterium]CAG0952988.1 Lipopolysaccharide export system ATP-binding protein LptB [Burkholderiales bacterium]
MSEVMLEAVKLTRLFGGLAANQEVSLRLVKSELHALVGPNGAGKSTCINLLSGDLAPSSGSILLQGQDITALATHQRSLAGIGRSYQRSNVFMRFTVFENVRLAAQSRRPRAWRVWARALDDRDVNERAAAAIAEVGLERKRERIVGELSHGERRQLEVAMVLATDARVLLFDEPLAGMGAEESQHMVALLQRLTAERAILLVEHDMDAVFAAAQTITVMVNGQVLESGPPEKIRDSAAVREAYLGDDEVVHE